MTSARIAAYRSYRPMDIPERVAGMEAFNDRRALAAQEGDDRMEAATARAWAQDAVLLAATPAASGHVDQKVEYLREHLDGWVLSGRHADENQTYAAMIGAAITIEFERWALTGGAKAASARRDDETRRVSRMFARILAPKWMEEHFAFTSIRNTVDAAVQRLVVVKSDIEVCFGVQSVPT